MGNTGEVIGSLYNVDLTEYCPPALQPNGVGTPVTVPTMTPAEHTGLWTLGCGHSTNHPEVIPAMVNGVLAADVRCPVCGYVQTQYSPFDKIYDNYLPIIVP